MLQVWTADKPHPQEEVRVLQSVKQQQICAMVKTVKVAPYGLMFTRACCLDTVMFVFV